MNKDLSYLASIIFSSLALSMSPYLWRLKFENGYIIYVHNHRKKTNPKNVKKMAFLELSKMLKDIFQIGEVNFYENYSIMFPNKFIIKIPFQTFWKLNLS
ncbi:hypothetical protein EOM09_02245 [bacterium]|nr:hypothetical protein [bacterium]